MKIVEEEVLISRGAFAESPDWTRIAEEIRSAVRSAEWPPNTGTGIFTIRPMSRANGVKPIKLGPIAKLKAKGWNIEHPFEFEEVSDEGRTAATVAKPGDFDAVLSYGRLPIAVEWETGNISSSHRALNKMALGLLRGSLAAGTLIVPSKKLYPYLTDRVGNISELRPYFDLWRIVPCREGVLQIIVIEHDAADTAAPLIPKGTDGRAKR